MTQKRSVIEVSANCEKSKKKKREKDQLEKNDDDFEQELKEEATNDVKFIKDFEEDIEELLEKINLDEVMTEKIKKKYIDEKLKLLGITRGNYIEQIDTGVERFKSLLLEIIKSEASDESIEKLLFLIKSYRFCYVPKVEKKEILRAQSCLFPLLFPEMALREKASEAEFLSDVFSSFCNVSDLFADTITNGRVVLDGSQNQSLNEKLQKLNSDRQISFVISASGESVVRMLQEDSPIRLKESAHHPDELKLIILMRIAHSNTIRKILTKPNDTFYSNLYTYGLLTSPNRVELLGFKCNIKEISGSFSLLDYQLVNFGKFNIANRSLSEISPDQFIELGSNILSRTNFQNERFNSNRNFNFKGAGYQNDQCKTKEKGNT